MPVWPKTIVIRGVGIPVESWEEMDELLKRYGSEGPIVIHGAEQKGPGPKKKLTSSPSALSATDQSLLQQFVEGGAKGVLTTHIGPALGRKGKGIRPALEQWSRRIGLVTEERASAFKPVKTSKGRGFRLEDVYLRAARQMLGL